jgi:hypothetical protein
MSYRGLRAMGIKLPNLSAMTRGSNRVTSPDSFGEGPAAPTVPQKSESRAAAPGADRALNGRSSRNSWGLRSLGNNIGSAVQKTFGMSESANTKAPTYNAAFNGLKRTLVMDSLNPFARQDPDLKKIDKYITQIEKRTNYNLEKAKAKISSYSDKSKQYVAQMEGRATAKTPLGDISTNASLKSATPKFNKKLSTDKSVGEQVLAALDTPDGLANFIKDMVATDTLSFNIRIPITDETIPGLSRSCCRES